MERNKEGKKIKKAGYTMQIISSTLLNIRRWNNETDINHNFDLYVIGSLRTFKGIWRSISC